LLGRDYIKLFFHKEKAVCYDLKSVLGYLPLKPDLYLSAFINRGQRLVDGNGMALNNERLEFLGDTILSTIIADYLYHQFPCKDEGFLSQMRSCIVKRKKLNELSQKIGLDEAIQKYSNTSNPGKNFNGNVLEALTAVIYIDKGFEFTHRWLIKNLIQKHIAIDELLTTEIDFKSRIIEWAQKSHKIIRFESNEDNSGNSRCPVFICSIVIDGLFKGTGKGFSKKEAEQNAAQYVLTMEHSTKLG